MGKNVRIIGSGRGDRKGKVIGRRRWRRMCEEVGRRMRERKE